MFGIFADGNVLYRVLGVQSPAEQDLAHHDAKRVHVGFRRCARQPVFETLVDIGNNNICCGGVVCRQKISKYDAALASARGS